MPGRRFNRWAVKRAARERIKIKAMSRRVRLARIFFGGFLGVGLAMTVLYIWIVFSHKSFLDRIDGIFFSHRLRQAQPSKDTEVRLPRRSLRSLLAMTHGVELRLPRRSLLAMTVVWRVEA